MLSFECSVHFPHSFLMFELSCIFHYICLTLYRVFQFETMSSFYNVYLILYYTLFHNINFMFLCLLCTFCSLFFNGTVSDDACHPFVGFA